MTPSVATSPLSDAEILHRPKSERGRAKSEVHGISLITGLTRVPPSDFGKAPVRPPGRRPDPTQLGRRTYDPIC
jgi:hypothetical protein